MKFIHLADLHLGKIIYQNNLLDIQIDLLNQVMNYMVQKKIKNIWFYCSITAISFVIVYRIIFQ